MTTGNTITPPDAYVVPIAVNESTTAGLFETTIVTSEQQLDIGGGQLANLEVYNGTAPGPTLFLQKDETVVVRLINQLPHPSGIHWHGIELPNAADGTPVTQSGLAGAVVQTLGDGTPAGGTYLYKFTVPRPGLYWYHPHHYHSTNRVFRQTFGMIVVADPNEATLITNGTLPDAANTYQLVLSDITVCKAIGSNDATNYPAGMPWVGGSTLPVQSGPNPLTMCELEPKDEHGDPRVDAAMNPIPFNQFDVPNLQKPARVNEGQTVLTNGVNVGGRAGTPDVPGALDAGAQTVNVAPGQGLRLQIVNTATTRYFRLILKVQTGAGVVTVPLVRVGGEGGLLDVARIEGGVIGGFDTKFTAGEIVLPPASRADVVAPIPSDATGIATLWTQDYQRTGAAADNFWANIPTVPVMHLNITGTAGSYSIADGTQILESVSASVPILPAPTGTFLPVPAGKLGNPTLQITLQPGPAVDGVAGDFSTPPIYTDVAHLGSTRYAAADDILMLTVANDTDAHHPFHLHGFSFQPVALTHATDPGYTWDYNEFRDNLDIPAHHTLTAKVHFDNRPWHDGVTLGGNFGRWLFHCHIFHHAHKGMISELVVTSPDGTEKPDVSVGGSWAYAAIPGTATRSGKFSHPDGLPVTLTSHLGDGTPIGTISTSGDTWNWTLDTTGMLATTDYVYVTATDGTRTSQTVFRLQVGGSDLGSDNGDPHIHTIDGQRYDFQGAGEFVLLKDDHGLEIQTRQTPVPTQNPINDNYTGLQVCVAVNTAVAARVGDTWLSYQPGAEQGSLEFFMNGKPTKLPERGFAHGHRISTFDADGAVGLRIDWAHGTVLQVTPRFWSSHNIWYMNLAVSNATGRGGLMAPIAPGSWLPPLPGGQPLGPRPRDPGERYRQLYQIFGEAWRVNDQTSLFHYRTSTSTDTFTDRAWPGEGLPCNVTPGLEIPGAPVLTGMDVAQAEQVCSFLADDGLRQDCVFDVAVTGDESFAAGYRFAADLKAKSTGVTVAAGTGERDGVSFTVLIAKVRLLGGGIPSGGKVTFWSGDTRLSPEISIDSDGTATWEPDADASGARDVTARFEGGDSGFDSESPAIEVDIVPAPAGETKPEKKWSWLIWLVVALLLLLILVALL